MSTPHRSEKELIEKIKALPPDKISEVEDFVDFLRQRVQDRNLARGVTQLSEEAFRNAWENPEDAEYDRL